jgi:hypothetical protein
MKRAYEDPTMNVVTFETEDIMALPQVSRAPSTENPDGEGEFEEF